MTSLKEIRAHLNKDIEQTPLVLINGFFAAYIAKVLLYLPISANQLSFFMGVLAVIAGILFALGDFYYSIIALILLFLQENLDYIDGLIARFKGTASMRGIFVDALVHSISAPLVFLGLALGVFKNTGNIWFLILGVIAAIFTVICTDIQPLKNHAFVIKLIGYSQGKKVEELEGKKLERLEMEDVKKSSFLKNFIKKSMGLLSFHYTPFVLIFSIIFDFNQWVLVFYGIAFPIKWFIVMMYEFKIDYKHLEYLFKPYKK